MSDTTCWNIEHGDAALLKSECIGCLQEHIAELEWEYASVINQFHDALKHNTKLEKVAEAANHWCNEELPPSETWLDCLLAIKYALYAAGYPKEKRNDV